MLRHHAQNSKLLCLCGLFIKQISSEAEQCSQRMASGVTNRNAEYNLQNAEYNVLNSLIRSIKIGRRMNSVGVKNSAMAH